MKTTKMIGSLGESLAEKYLEKRGWKIISKNFMASGGEIDLIGYRFGVLAYFEVKTRTSNAYGTPADAVDGEKIERIKKAARTFLKAYRISGKIPVFYPFGIEKLRKIRKERIDVIEIYLSRDCRLESINHIKDRGETGYELHQHPYKRK